MKSQISKQIIPRERIEQKIHFLRGQKVILSSDLALLYSVPVKALVQAVFATIKQMLETPIPPRRTIGFHPTPDPRRPEM